MLHKEITDRIIQGFYHVYNTLGYGFQEKVYENSLKITLEKYGDQVGQQIPIAVFFETIVVGEYFADLVVNDRVIIEVKACDGLDESHETQLINYLKATDKEVGILVNFGPKPQFRRKIFTNDRK